MQRRRGQGPSGLNGACERGVRHRPITPPATAASRRETVRGPPRARYGRRLARRAGHAPDAIDEIAAREDPGVEQSVAGSALGAERIAAQGHEIGVCADRDAAGVAAERRAPPPASAPSNSARPVEPPGRAMHIARAARQPLGVFELPQFVGERRSATLESRADAEAPPCAEKAGALNMPSPRLASVIGQRPATAPLAASRARLAVVMCVAWIEAPARDRRRRGRAAIRPAARPTRRGSPRPP